MTMGDLDNTPSERIFYFDIDNCLYSPDLGIHLLMKDRIYAFGKEIGLDSASVVDTCSSYYKDYGLTVRGLINHHGIDVAAFNKKVDGDLPLESVIKPDPALRQMILSIKTRRWAFTNAGIEHARRVLKCLQVDDLFEGITYCDYAEPNFPCKPERRAYEKAMRESGVKDMQLCYFADDSVSNVKAAKEIGWTAVLVSKQLPSASATTGLHITTIHELPMVLPQLFI
ncbi:suppressor of deletion of TFIIS [Coemansia aciculifera]|uniref:Suppressor of deletion of TFIIS n=1 Tax=Coemansia aciculifera TaxID=417176 RepID=A0A9W8IE03_9FUNG|nr:suppressor of deletion of TFIIS [Coemansia aciculifera]KAJ2871093.1 suppressor of deletion of TFIIS [Coemansia aciculifera]